MSQCEQSPARVHALLIFSLMLLPVAIPALANWPWALLAPLAGYALIVLTVPALRRSANWLCFGRLDREIGLATLFIGASASLILLLWFRLSHPDLTLFVQRLPANSGAPLFLAGCLFAVLNAVLEEAIFRGILYDALEVRVGASATVWIQGMAFGVLHSNGIPHGVPGMLLASAFGVALGWLRQRSGGLAACSLAHICADATIFALVASQRP